MRLSFVGRLALTTLLVTAVGMLLLALALVVLVGSYEAQRREAELRDQTRFEAQYLAELASFSGVRAAAALEVDRLAVRGGDVQMRVFGLGSELLASTTTSAGYFPSQEAAELLTPALPLRASAAQRRYAAEPVLIDGQLAAVVELSHSRAEEQRLLALIEGVLLRATVIALLAALLVSALIGRLLGRRVYALRAVAESIAAGDLERRAAITGSDELADLGHSLNLMAEQLAARLDELRASTEHERSVYRDVSHELRTPLMALQGYLEQLEDDATPEQQPTLDALRRELERLTLLARSLAQPGSGASTLLERRPVDLAALARDLTGALAGRAARTGIYLTLDLPDSPLPPVPGSADRLRQALLNLLDNALRHTQPGGAVTVALRPTSLGGSPAVALTVRDSGPGVPAELRDQIWERGVRGPGGGSGLGLALVREIAAAHGGRALLEDAPSGAAFTLLLPVAG